MWRDYYELCKPRVVFLMLITAWVGMLLASHHIPLATFIYASLGITFASGAAAVINQVVEHKIDQRMKRTEFRPVATGRVSPEKALTFSAVLGVFGLSLLYWGTNPLTCWLTLLSLVGYALVYTLFLKHATPQNIVIGGLAGAAPPLLGWTAISGSIEAYALLLVLIIFTWTPPHFWALALYRQEDYKRAQLPMLPITHGVKFTKLSILLYTILLIIVTLLPFLTGMSGMLYLSISLALNAVFLYYVISLISHADLRWGLKTFHFSISYLFILFIALIVDHYI
jgi:protoheme IX farnesyltransferase